jgi:hypothetical protein
MNPSKKAQDIFNKLDNPVIMGIIKSIAIDIKKDYALALVLWESGQYAAR